MQTATREIRTYRTMCPMNCHPTYCGMLIDVEDGHVVRVRGDQDNPDSRGFLCIRGRTAHEAIENPLRVRTPLKRLGKRGEDRWTPVSWEEALDAIAAVAQEAGRERVLVGSGHGALVNTIDLHFVRRFAKMYGCQWWNPIIICWGLGAYGLLLTGVIESNTKEDIGEHSNTIILWGADIASQPNTAPHLIAARRRGATIVTIDCRRSDAAKHADRVILVRPGTDAALALGLMHVIVGENLHDRDFIASHTVGFEELERALVDYTPEYVSTITGVSPDEIRWLARQYASQKPSTIILGGSSLFKHQHGWQAARAVSCLPALVGQLGVSGGGLGPRHRGFPHGEQPGDIFADNMRPEGSYIRSHMGEVVQTLQSGAIDLFLLMGTNFASSFADSNAVARALSQVKLIAVHDLFLSETARKWADYVLPGTSWVEEVGIKWTNTHLYLMERMIEPYADSRPAGWVLGEIARRLGVEGYYPWANQEGAIDAILAAGGYPSCQELREMGGMMPMRVGQIAYPDHRYHTPSGKVEFFSKRALELGLPALPVFEEPGETPISRPDLAARYPLVLRPGRILTMFHSFNLSGQALPTLAKANPGPVAWIHPNDAGKRGIVDGDEIELYNDRGTFGVRAHVTPNVLAGVVWMSDGWPGLNRLTSAADSLPPQVSEGLPFQGGQSSFEALVDVRKVSAKAKA